jgi:putative heme-binding domain-containing protein
LEPAEPVEGRLSEQIRAAWLENPGDLVHLDLAIRAGIQEAWRTVRRELTAEETQDERKRAILETVRDSVAADMAPLALDLVVAPSTAEAVRLSGLDVLVRIADEASILELLKRYDAFSPAVRSRVRGFALSRPMSARCLLDRVDEGSIDAKEIAVDELRVVALHKDPKLDALVNKHWGRVGTGTPEEMLATMRRFSNDLRASTGDAARGKELFTKHCGTCHVLFGEGAKVGPDLTTANRGDRAALLANIVDPSAVVRREYLQYAVETSSGQVLTGLIAEQDAASITILDAKNIRTRLDRSDVEAIRESTTSLMPERILDALSPQELRDLFAYLEANSKSESK